MPITLLPPDLVGKIAAGEVVERPASAVKELIENALDAGARRISVEVRVGGRELLKVTRRRWRYPARRVTARACSSTPPASCAVADDLNQIATLGFRGEALGSLAAVARVTLVSRPPDAPIRLRDRRPRRGAECAAPGRLPARHHGHGARSLRQCPGAPEIPARRRDRARRDQGGSSPPTPWPARRSASSC